MYSTSTTSTTSHHLQSSKDTELNPAPSDGISDLSFSPTSDLLAVSSWDNQTRIYDVQLNTFNSTFNSILKTSIIHDQPVLCCTFSSDGSKVFSAGCDKQIKVLDLGSGQQIALQGHDQPVKSIKWSPSLNTLVSASWDKSLKYWDLRSPNPVATIALPERAYSMDLCKNHLVVACAERHLAFVNLSSPSQLSKQTLSNLKWQTRVVACYSNSEGYALGSIEGRVSLNNFDDGPKTSSEFTFKCQRNDNLVYAVNAISFHPIYGTFSTAGSDGNWAIWDKDSKQRLKASEKSPNSISATAFNRNGNIFAYAVSYDWSKGFEHNQREGKNSVMLSATKESDVKPRGNSSLPFNRRR